MALKTRCGPHVSAHHSPSALTPHYTSDCQPRAFPIWGILLRPYMLLARCARELTLSRSSPQHVTKGSCISVPHLSRTSEWDNAPSKLTPKVLVTRSDNWLNNVALFGSFPSLLHFSTAVCFLYLPVN